MGYVTNTRLPAERGTDVVEEYRELHDMLRDGRTIVPNVWCPEVDELAHTIHDKLLRRQEKGNG